MRVMTRGSSTTMKSSFGCSARAVGQQSIQLALYTPDSSTRTTVVEYLDGGTLKVSCTIMNERDVVVLRYSNATAFLRVSNGKGASH